MPTPDQPKPPADPGPKEIVVFIVRQDTKCEECGRGLPGCPPDEAGAIAEYACAKHSGRVGRSAAAKEFDPAALRLAVIAHIRHQHTPYDRLLGETGDRSFARAKVSAEIDRVFTKWERGVGK